MNRTFIRKVREWLSGYGSAKVLLLLCFCFAALTAVGCLFHYDCPGRTALAKLMAAAAVFAFFSLFPKVTVIGSTDFLCIILMLWAIYESVLGAYQLYGPTGNGDRIFAITGSFDNPNPYAVLLSVSVCVLGMWRRKRKNAVVRAVATIAVMLSLVMIPATRCRAAWTGLGAGILITAFPFWKMSPARAVSFGLVGIILMSGLYLWKKQSADGRLQLWRISCMAIGSGAAGGLLGHGPGHFAPAAAAAQLEFFDSRIGSDGYAPVIPDAVIKQCHRSQPMVFAYNDLLQSGVEMGLFGMLLFAAVSLLSLGRLLCCDSPLAGGMVVLSVSGLFMYTLCLWQFFLLNAAFVGTAACNPDNGCSGKWHVLAKTTAVLVPVALMLPWAVGRYRNMKGWQTEAHLLNSGDYAVYARCEEPRSEYLSDIPVFMSGYSFALSQAGMIEKSDSIARIAYSQSGNPYFLVQLGDNRMMNREYEAAVGCYMRAFISFPDRLLPLVRLARCYAARGDEPGLESVKRFVSTFHTHVESDATAALRDDLKAIVIE